MTWQLNDIGPWGSVRSRARTRTTALLRWGTWDVEWLADSHADDRPAPQPDQPAWHSNSGRWHPLTLLPAGTRRHVLRAARSEVERSADPGRCEDD